MRRRFLIAFATALALSSSGAAFAPRDAHASVSIAVLFDALVKDAESVAVVTPIEQKSVWENGRICTYTRVRVDNAVSGRAAIGEEKWVRTLGGVVGKIGQTVDGEPTLIEGKQSLLFLHKREPGIFEVSARAQGQFPVVTDSTKRVRLVKHAALGPLLPPRDIPANAAAGTIRLANEVLHDKDLASATLDIQRAWQRIHTETK